MGLVVYLVAGDVRRRWRSYAGLVVLLGIFGGLSLFALAGARRTESSYPAFLRATRASTMSVSGGPLDRTVNAAIGALPEVARSRTSVSFGVYVLSNGTPDFAQVFEPTGTFDGSSFDQDRFTPTRGRRPDPARADEVAVNELAARRFGYHVGQTFELGTFSEAQDFDPEFRIHPSPPKVLTMVRIVGIGVFPSEVLQDDGDRVARLLVTPAFTRASAGEVTYGIQFLQLVHGNRDVEVVKQRVAKIIPPSVLKYRVTSVDEFHALQALRPLAIALFAFGGLTGVAGMVLVTQGITRVIRADREQRSALRAFGASRAAVVGATAGGACAATLLGGALAVTLASAASPAMPIGPVRRVLGAARFNFDGAVMLVGLVVIVFGLWAGTLLAASLEARRQGRSQSRRARRRPIAGRASDIGMTPVAVTGLSFALGSPDSAITAPTRSVMVGAAVAVAALVASIIFGTSSSRLVHRPALYGWSADAAIVAGRGYGNIPRAKADAILGQDPDLESWTGVYFGRDTINGSYTPLLGMDVGSPLMPPLLHGRQLAHSDEIVLGPATASRIHKGIGDVVTVASGGSPRLLTVVGIATFPTIGVFGVEHTSLGVGALVVHELVPGFDRDITGKLSGDLGPQMMLVRLRTRSNPQMSLAHLLSITRPLADFSGLDVVPVQRPAEIASLVSVTSAPIYLAAVLALAAMTSLGLALSTAVRQRRRDLAILKSLGFTGRQLAGTVSWLATAMIVGGLLGGVPFGVVTGRALWTIFARQLDVVAAPRIPVLSLVGLSVATVMFANLIAVLPGSRARRVDALRLLHQQ